MSLTLQEIEKRKRHMKERKDWWQALEKTGGCEYSDQEMGLLLIPFSGQKCGPMWETWGVTKGYFTSKISNKKGCGDVCRKNGEILEIKSRFIERATTKKRTIIGGGQQFRLWEQVDSYLLILTNKKTYETTMHEIPKKVIIDACRDNLLSFSSSHGTAKLIKKDGKKMTIDEAISMKIEIGIQFSNSATCDWSQYKITEKDLVNRNK